MIATDSGPLGAALADAKTPEAFLAAADLLGLEHAASRTEEAVPWQHPDYPEDRISAMGYEEIAEALFAIQKLPKNSELMRAEDLRELLRESARNTDVRKRYETIKTQREEQRERNRENRRKIIVNDQRLRDITDRALNALIEANNPPFVFVRGRSLVRITVDENGLPIIESLSPAGVKGILERCCEFYRLRATDAKEVPLSPPKEVVDDLMSLPEWDIPALKGITECPTIRPDGGILAAAGYDSVTRQYYAPFGGLVLPSIPEHPTQEDIQKSVDLLTEVFCDFPFVDDASRTNMIAVIISFVVRPIISGPVPLAIFDKPQAGTGASLLSEVIALIATGRSAAMMPAPTEEAAWQKLITSMLSVGRNLAIIDNVEAKLYVPSLASILTSSTWTDRRFGRNDEMITLPHSMIWICTGNNVLLGGDLPRRCYWIRLDAHSARPWQRSEFMHPDLEEWVSTHRGEIIAAILTMARCWILAGKPKPDTAIPKMGSFDSWRYTIGGILGYCKVPDFLGNLEAMYELADTDGPQWEAFIVKWHSVFGSKPVTVADLQLHMQRESDSANVAYGSERLVDLLPDNLADAWAGKKSFVRVLGRTLSKMNGRVFLSGLVFQKGKDAHKVATWIVSAKTGGLEK